MVNSTITIEAYGTTLQWNAGGHARAFLVANGGNLTIHNALIKGFSAKGGNGSDGGGGGLGAGGAIYVADGSVLTVENCTFESNVATGGNGGNNAEPSIAGGGGGGMGGNGGQAGVFDDGLYAAGGGGGGSRGNGYSTGGAGGGTVVLQDMDKTSYLNCGGFPPASGLLTDNGGDGRCPGGGGSGGGGDDTAFTTDNGGNGDYGGGGGGGGGNGGSGGNGGFGGGGGGSNYYANIISGPYGGNGGFGGGGGSGARGGGSAGLYGGLGSNAYGGGGGALGGAIFNTGGTLVVRNSTFFNNSVDRGNAGGAPADNGADAGGAIFSFNGRVTIEDSTISGNQSTGSAAGVEAVETDATLDTVFILNNTIIFNNGTTDANGNPAGTAAECSGYGKTLSGAGNLIQNNLGCPGVVTTGDPLLGPLKINRGFTPTMAIGPTSAAFNTADTSTSLSVDQRGIPRPSDGGFDIGAFEYCDFARDFNCNIAGVVQTEPLTIIVSPPAGGTTTPGAGTNLEVQNTVTTVSATAAPGYLFSTWVGNVAAPSSAATTVIMNQAQTITAMFVPCGCATDVSASITVTRGGYVLNPGTGRFVQTVTLTNNSANTITGPISLVLTGLSANAALYNATGSTDSDFPPVGAPYVNSSTTSLAPGQSISISLQFTNPTRAAITYSTQVLAGPGVR